MEEIVLNGFMDLKVQKKSKYKVNSFSKNQVFHLNWGRRQVDMAWWLFLSRSQRNLSIAEYTSTNGK